MRQHAPAAAAPADRPGAGAALEGAASGRACLAARRASSADLAQGAMLAAARPAAAALRLVPQAARHSVPDASMACRRRCATSRELLTGPWHSYVGVPVITWPAACSQCRTKAGAPLAAVCQGPVNEIMTHCAASAAGQAQAVAVSRTQQGCMQVWHALMGHPQGAAQGSAVAAAAAAAARGAGVGPKRGSRLAQASGGTREAPAPGSRIQGPLQAECALHWGGGALISCF